MTPFKAILEASRRESIRELQRRAVLTNRIAKVARTASGRQRSYLQKSAAIIQLIHLGDGHVMGMDPACGMASVLLTDGRRFHVPPDQLPVDVRPQSDF